MKVPWLAKAQLCKAAEDLTLQVFGSPNPQLPVELERIVFEYLCEYHNLRFSDEQVLGYVGSHETLGRTDLVAGRILVCASLKARDLRRYRFTLAHEIGHWVLHRPLVRASLTTDEFLDADWTSLTTSETHLATQSIDRAEWQANIFASHLLLPRKALLREFEKRFGSTPLTTPFGTTTREYARQIARSPCANTISLADEFLTSLEATAIALEQLQLVSDQALLL